MDNTYACNASRACAGLFVGLTLITALRSAIVDVFVRLGEAEEGKTVQDLGLREAQNERCEARKDGKNDEICR